MLARIKFLFLYWLIWILFFELCRVGFLLYNFQYTRSFSTSLILHAFSYGVKMDASMASYIILPVCLFLLAGFIWKGFYKPSLYIFYTGIILLPMLGVVFGDLPVYRIWGNRLDATALKYLASPKEAWASVSNLPIFWLVVGFLIVYWIIFTSWRKFIRANENAIASAEKKWAQLILLVVFICIQIIPLRGGLQQSPLNQSSVYFSTHNYINLATLNAPWNFMYSLNQHSGSTANPFIYLDSTQAKKIKDSLLIQAGATNQLIDLTKTNKPNVIVVVWESFIEKATHLSKKGIEVTPYFNQLKKEGVYFPNIYCSGDRTDKGIVAVLSGYPAQPTTSIIKIPTKAATLPTLPKLYHDQQYQTSFYYGGELEFANMKSYLLGSGFQQFTSKSDFDKKDQNSKWGAHDQVVKDRILNDLAKTNTPFFTTWLTLSSHEPFETPVKTVIEGKDDESMFFNSLHYTDSVLYAFVQACKQQPWWNNTVMIITADHGHRLPQTGRQADDFKIPLLWLGGALTKTGINIAKTGSQIDIAAMLAGQTGIAGTPFTWSKDLLKENTGAWAYFTVYNLFGFVQPDRYYIFDNISRQIIEKKGNISQEDLNKGKAFEQLSFQDYLDR